MYTDFVHARTITREPKRKTPGTGDVANYHCFVCPHCRCEVEVPELSVKQRKSTSCKAHLAVCPKYTPPTLKETDLATELRKAREAHEAEREESKRRHEELMAQLSEANGQLSAVEGQLSSVKGQLTDVEDQLRDKRQCLTDVREWGQLKEPDNSLVPQLTYRETALVGGRDAEIARLKAELEVMRAAAKDKTPTAIANRAAEAEANATKVEREAEARVTNLQHEFDLFRATKHTELTNAKENLSRALDRADNLKRKIQLLIHPDKAPEGAREWATHVFQSVFSKRS